MNPPPGFEDKDAFKKMTIETEKDLEKLERRLKLVEKKMFEVKYPVIHETSDQDWSLGILYHN